MLSSPKAKSVEFELIKTVFTTSLEQEATLFDKARSMLLSQFLTSKDPNLAYLGLDAFSMMLSTLEQRNVFSDQDVDLITLEERTTVVCLFNSSDVCI